MKNKTFSDLSAFAFAIARFIKRHVLELTSPETPSYKTSASVIPIFAILAFAAGDKQTLFWIATISFLFFAILAVFQYGYFSKSKRGSTNSSL